MMTIQVLHDIKVTVSQLRHKDRREEPLLLLNRMGLEHVIKLLAPSCPNNVRNTA